MREREEMSRREVGEEVGEVSGEKWILERKWVWERRRWRSVSEIVIGEELFVQHIAMVEGFKGGILNVLAVITDILNHTHL